MSTEGRERSARGSRNGIEEGQRKLTLEGGKQGKQVGFKEKVEIREIGGIEELEKEVRALATEFKNFKEDVRKELAEMKAEREKYENKANELERKLLEVEGSVLERFTVSREEREIERTEGSGSEWSIGTINVSKGSRGRSSRASSRSRSEIDSDAFSDREVGKLKRLVADKDKEERKNNIIIRGIRGEELEKVTKTWIEEMIKEKLDLEVRVTRYWISGKVVIGCLENEVMKKEVMYNKRKLKGERFFIEHDLTWLERNTQKEIARWVRLEREKGRAVKIGMGRVKVGGIWKRWEEIEKEEGGGSERGDGQDRREGEEVLREVGVGEMDKENFA